MHTKAVVGKIINNSEQIKTPLPLCNSHYILNCHLLMGNQKFLQECFDEAVK